MSVDMQVIVDMVVNMLLISFPISLVFMLGAKLANVFSSFVVGREVRL